MTHFDSRHVFSEFLPGEYSPPVVATLVTGRRRSFYQRLEAWQPPEGWERGPSVLELAAYPNRRPGLACRKLGAALVIHDPITLDTHSLNETAAVLFELCDGSRQFREIRDAYADRYELELWKATADAERLFEDFLEKKLLLVRSERTEARNSE